MIGFSPTKPGISQLQALGAQQNPNEALRLSPSTDNGGPLRVRDLPVVGPASIARSMKQSQLSDPGDSREVGQCFLLHCDNFSGVHGHAQAVIWHGQKHTRRRLGVVGIGLMVQFPPHFLIRNG